ncbi:hypothetical protein PENTCL1PPCAC_1193, partial [Pristionchus entomophagus]
RRKEKRQKQSREKEEGNGRVGGEKRGSNGEKEREGNQHKKRKKPKTHREVELESIHLSKQKKRDKVERMPLKPDNWHDVEREPLYNYMPHQYENLPEDPAIKALKQNPNANLYTQRSDPPCTNGRSVTEPTDKKAATERDKKDQCSTGPELSEVMEKSSITADLIKFIKNPPCCLWMLVIVLFVLCFGLFVGVMVLAGELKRLREAISSPRSP